MTWERLAFAGFETQGPEVSISSNMAIVDTFANGGDYALRATNQTSGFNRLLRAAKPRIRAHTYFLRPNGVNRAGVSNVYPRILYLNNSISRIVSVAYGADGNISLVVDETIEDAVAIGSTGMAIDVWDSIGIDAYVANDETGFARVYVGGLPVLEYTGAIAGGSVASVGATTANAGFWSASVYPLWDDLTVDGSDEMEDAAAPPNPVYEYRIAEADSITSEWTPVGEASNYLCVDDSSGPDDDATYVESATEADRDLYTVGDYTAPAGYVISAVISSLIARKTASASNLRVAPLIYDGDNVGVGDPIDLPTTYSHVWERFAEKPNTGGAWGTATGETTAVGQDTVEA